MFKVGDRVRIVNHSNYQHKPIILDLPVGSEHTVVNVMDQGIGEECYTLSGSNNHFYVAHNIELVSSNPVRTVTRREIVPGTYGRVIVGKTYEAGIWFEIADDEKGALILTAEELDNVAMIASQLAEALRDG